MTRPLVPAFLAGLAGATIFGNDLHGWIAAGASLAIFAMARKVRGTDQTCAMAAPAVSDRVGGELGAGSSDLSG